MDRVRFGQLVISVARLWRRAADEALENYGQSMATGTPLITLSRMGDNLRQGVLADHLGLEGPSLVRVIDLLLAEGLVNRAEDPSDRRAKIISLTDTGRRRAAEIELILKELRAELLADIPEAELDSTIRVLSRLEARLSGASD